MKNKENKKNKKNVDYKKIFLYSTLLFFSIFNFSDAYTVTKLDVDIRNDFVVGPGRTELFINPGESVVKNITVTNRTNRTVDFKVTEEDFVGSDDPETPVILLGDEKGPYSLRDFIDPEIDSFTLESGEQIKFDVRVTIPADSEPGGFYGAMVISNVPEEDQNANAKIISRIGSLFLVRVNGPVEESGELSDFKVIEPKVFYTERPDGFEIFFENNGTVHLVPYGTIEIENMFGRVIDILPVDAYASLPEAVRYRQVLWEDGFAMGRYKANLSLYKGYGDEFDNAQVSFWVLPWKVILIALAIIALLSSLIYLISTKFEFKRRS